MSLLSHEGKKNHSRLKPKLHESHKIKVQSLWPCTFCLIEDGRGVYFMPLKILPLVALFGHVQTFPFTNLGLIPNFARVSLTASATIR